MERITYEPPKLIILFGWPGSGKSTLATKILEHVQGIHVNKDDISMAFTTDVQSELYRTLVGPATYETMKRIAYTNLQIGNTTILDAPFNQLLQGEDCEAGIDALAKQNGYDLRYILCTAPNDIVRERIIARAHPRDQTKLNNWEQYTQKAHVAHITVPHLHLNLTNPVHTYIPHILEYLVK